MAKTKIGLGIFCFGEKYYFDGAVVKIEKFLEEGFSCYVLTDNPLFFSKEFYRTITIIPYHRSFKSYHDKVILAKHIIKTNDFFYIIDADAQIKDYSLIKDLKNYKLNNGITYVDILKNHPLNKQYVGELEMQHTDWRKYKEYIETLYPDYPKIELVWEYLIGFNTNEFNISSFFNIYERLQLAKEFCYINQNKDVYANGEGISLQIASLMSNTPIQRDLNLYDLIKEKITSVSARYK